MQALKSPVNRTFNNHIPQPILSDGQYLEESGKLCGIDLHLLNSPLCELKFFSILWFQFQFHSLSLCCCLKKKEQANHKQSSWRMPMRIMLLFLSHSQGFFGNSLSFCPGDLGWFSASDYSSCHFIEGIRMLPLSWNWSQSHWPYCTNLSFCSLGWVISYLSIVKFQCLLTEFLFSILNQFPKGFLGKQAQKNRIWAARHELTCLIFAGGIHSK